MSWLIEVTLNESFEGVDASIKRTMLVKQANSFGEAYTLAKRWAKLNNCMIVHIEDLTIDGMKEHPYLDVEDI
jgi:hypothetical protein